MSVHPLTPAVPSRSRFGRARPAGDIAMVSVNRYDIEVSYVYERISTICILNLTAMEQSLSRIGF